MLDGLSKNFDIKVILRITFIFFFFGQTLDFFSDRPWTFRTDLGPWTFRTDLGLFGPLKKLSIFSTIFYKFFQVIMIFFCILFFQNINKLKEKFFLAYVPLK